MRIEFVFLIIFLLTAIFCSPGFVKAKTVDNSVLIMQIKAKIIQLIIELKTLLMQQENIPSLKLDNSTPKLENPTMPVATKPSSDCIANGNNGTKIQGAAHNCCAGLTEVDIAITNSIPGSVLYKCFLPN